MEIEKYISTYRSDDGKRFAHIYESYTMDGIKYYLLKFYEDNQLLTEFPITDRSQYYVEDMAENFVLDIAGYFWVQ